LSKASIRRMDRIFVRHWRLHDMKNDRRLHGELKLGSKIPFFKGCCNLSTMLPGRVLSRAAGDKAAERLVPHHAGGMMVMAMAVKAQSGYEC